MLYGVKLNEKELLMVKKRLVFLNLYVQKNLKKFEMEISLLRKEDEGTYIS